MRLIASSILRISLRSRSRVRSSRLNSSSWVARSFGIGEVGRLVLHVEHGAVHFLHQVLLPRVQDLTEVLELLLVHVLLATPRDVGLYIARAGQQIDARKILALRCPHCRWRRQCPGSVIGWEITGLAEFVGFTGVAGTGSATDSSSVCSAGAAVLAHLRRRLVGRHTDTAGRGGDRCCLWRWGGNGLDRFDGLVGLG